MTDARIAAASYANWRAGYDQGRATERAEAAPQPLSARVPSHWLADQAIAAAVALLDQCPDLTADEDIALALGSEEPRALDFVAAFAAAAVAAEDAARMAGERATLLRERKAAMEARGEMLREKLADMLDRLRLRRVETPSGTVALRAGKPRVLVADVAELADEFVRVTVKRDPDKAAIAAAWKAGRTVPGAMQSNAPAIVSITVKP